MDVDVNVHWMFHRRNRITDGQPTTCFHDYYHLYIVTNTILEEFHFSENGIFHV